MKQKTLQTQYNLIREGKGSKETFLKEAKRIFPNYIPNAATFNQAENILKQKSIISENMWGIATPKNENPDWFAIFNESLNEEVKVEEKKTSKEVTDLSEKNFDYNDKKNVDNVYGEAFLKGYYCEMKDPKNAEKTIDEVKEMVAKNLAKDQLYYVKDGQFGTKGVGYTDDHPGLKASKSDQMEKVKLQESKNITEVSNFSNTYIAIFLPGGRIDPNPPMKVFTAENENDVRKIAGTIFSYDFLHSHFSDSKVAIYKILPDGETDLVDRVDFLKPQPMNLKKHLAEGKKYFGVFRKGGSIGQGNDKPLYSFVDREEAKQKAKNLRQTLTPGEKSYYGMGYTVKPTNIAPESVNRYLNESSNFSNTYIAMFLLNGKPEMEPTMKLFTAKNDKLAIPTARDIDFDGFEEDYSKIIVFKVLPNNETEYIGRADFTPTKLDEGMSPQGVDKPKPKKKKVKKETIDSKLAEIDKASNIVALEAKIEALAEIIESKTQRLNLVSEDESLSELMDKKKIKDMQKEIKLLEKKKAGMEKLYEKSCGKKYQQQEIVGEVEEEEEISESKKNNEFKVGDIVNLDKQDKEYKITNKRKTFGSKKFAYSIEDMNGKKVGEYGEDQLSKVKSDKEITELKKDQWGNHLEPEFKVGDKVTYLGYPAEVTSVNQETSGTYSYNVAYDKGYGRTKATNVYNKGGEIKRN